MKILSLLFLFIIFLHGCGSDKSDDSQKDIGDSGNISTKAAPSGDVSPTTPSLDDPPTYQKCMDRCSNNLAECKRATPNNTRTCSKEYGNCNSCCHLQVSNCPSYCNNHCGK